MQRLGSILFVFAIGCGGGGVDSPEDRCVALLDTVCDRVVECGLSESHDSCMQQIEDDADCGQAKGVGESYGACIGDIEDASCQALFPTSGGQQRLALPPSCADALE